MESEIARREFVGLVSGALAAPLFAPPICAQTKAPIFPGVDLNHINIRVSNCGRSALFYQGLFGGDMTYVHSVTPNPSTPSVESWYVLLGSHFLSITPVFPHLKLGVDIDHIAPAVREFKNNEQAAPIVKGNGLEIVEGTGVSAGAGWIRDPDRMIWQLYDGSIPTPSPGLTRRTSGDLLLKAGERQGTPFVPMAIRDITLRAADLNKTGDFMARVFGGEVKSDPSDKGRGFKFGRSEMRVIQRTSAMPSGVSLDHWTIEIKDFNLDVAKAALQQRGIQSRDDNRGGLRLTDPDGIEVHLA
jgi:hypothetical protein